MADISSAVGHTVANTSCRRNQLCEENIDNDHLLCEVGEISSSFGFLLALLFYFYFNFFPCKPLNQGLRLL